METLNMSIPEHEPEKARGREITEREVEAASIIEATKVGNCEAVDSVVETIKDSKGGLQQRLESTDALLLAFRKSECDETIGEAIAEATEHKHRDNFVMTQVLESVALSGRRKPNEGVYPFLETPAVSVRTPSDVISKETEDGEMLFLEVPDGYASLHRARKFRESTGEVQMHSVINDDFDPAKRIEAMKHFEKADSDRSVMEYLGEYVPINEYSEVTRLIKEGDLDITPEEYKAISESRFFSHTESVFGVDWEGLTLREQLYALSYLKTIDNASTEGSVAGTYLSKMGNSALASLQVASGGFDGMEKMMRTMLINRDFERLVLSTFRSIAGSADRIEEMLQEEAEVIGKFAVAKLLDEDVAYLREKMLKKGTAFMRKYMRLFDGKVYDKDHTELNDDEILDLIPIENGGRAYTPVTAEREMRGDIEAIRVDAEVYAQYILNEYKKNPESVHETLATDFRTLASNEIEKHELDFQRVLEKNRSRYIKDGAEMAERLDLFKEDLECAKTNPECKIQFQMFTFKENLIGFNTIETLGEPEDKHVRIESFSLETDVAHPVVAHAHIQKYLLGAYSEFTIEGEVHPDNRALLQTYIKQYGFVENGTVEKDGTKYVKVIREPMREKIG